MFAAACLVAVSLLLPGLAQEGLGTGVCNLQPDKGTCHGKVERFYFNKRRQKCEHFVYSGCGGNGNRFDSRMECRTHCDKCYQSKPATRRCTSLPKKAFFYNKGKASCQQFKYRCLKDRHNYNVFNTRGQCRTSCKLPIQASCKLPPKRGQCKLKLRPFYFNTRKRRCQSFTYSGCFGNDNNFETLQECKQVCERQRR